MEKVGIARLKEMGRDMDDDLLAKMVDTHKFLVEQYRHNLDMHSNIYEVLRAEQIYRSLFGRAHS